MTLDVNAIYVYFQRRSEKIRRRLEVWRFYGSRLHWTLTLIYILILRPLPNRKFEEKIKIRTTVWGRSSDRRTRDKEKRRKEKQQQLQRLWRAQGRKNTTLLLITLCKRLLMSPFCYTAPHFLLIFKFTLSLKNY